MSQYQCFNVSIENRIAHIQLCRPEKRNSMIPAFWSELPAIVEDIDNNARARVIVISSTGPHFSAGLDISAFAADGDGQLGGGQAFYTRVKGMQRAFSVLEDCRIPVLAAIQGGCIGGGVDLATACDMRYLSDDAFFVIQEINIGMTADVGTFPRLLNLLPEGLVRELAYTGRRFAAQEALAHGLVNAVYDNVDEMLAAVMEVAMQIAGKAPLAIAGSKRIINYARDHNTADTLDYISIWNASHLLPGEVMEAMSANMEGRAPEFAELPPIERYGDSG